MSWEKKCLGLLCVAVLAAFAVGCTSGGGGGIGSNSVAFWSARALDGTDASGLNHTNNIWTVRLDGSSATPLTKLTAANARSFDPSPSPRGTQVAFESERALDGSDAAINAFNIWVVNSDGTGATPLTKLTTNGANSFFPVWSPDGAKIVYESARALDGSDAINPGSTFNVWVTKADGTSPTPLTKLTKAACFFPVWSPDGTKIVFDSARALDGSDNTGTNNISNVWIVNADGSSPTPLTKLTAAGADSSFPVWSPDGTKIAYESSRALDGSDNANTNDTRNIWVMKADGSSPTPLTKLTASGTSSELPVWSSDGTKIAFESNRALDGSDAKNTNGTFNIWIVNADGSSPTPLTKLTSTNASSLGPVIFVTGGKIVFESRRALDGSDASNAPNGTFNIWIMNADGSSPMPLTKITAMQASSFVRLGD